MHTTNIILTEQVVFMYLGTHTTKTTIKEKEAMNLNENKEVYMEGFKGRKRKGK